MIKKICAYCGKEFEHKYENCKSNGVKKYCSNECRRSWQKENPYRKQNKIFINKDNDFAILLIETKTKGNFEVKIDIEDIEKVSKYCWKLGYDRYGRGFYILTRSFEKCKLLYLHRFIMDTPQHLQVDHINRIKTDNRKCNLRNCTAFENSQNLGTNTSGKVGVKFVPRRNKWIADIRKEKKYIYLGAFETFDEAVRTRVAAENNLFPKTAQH